MYLNAILVLSNSDDQELLLQILNSLINQSYSNFQLHILMNDVIINHSGVESSLMKINHNTIKVSNKLFFYEALNKIINRIDDNEIIVRVDPDDICEPERFAVINDFFNKQSNRDTIFYSNAYIVKPNGKKVSRPFRDHNIYFKNKYLSNPIVHSSTAFRAGLIKDIGCYPAFNKAQDFALWLKCHQNGIKFHGYRKELVSFKQPINLKAKRGLHYLKSELYIYWFAYKIGYSILPAILIRMVYQFSFRLIVQLTPNFLYKKFNS